MKRKKNKKIKKKQSIAERFRLFLASVYLLNREISQTGSKITNKQLDILYKRFIMKENVILYNSKQL